MTWPTLLNIFSLIDFLGLTVLVLGWLGIGWRIERRSSPHVSVNVLMETYRREWLKNMVTREPRVFDAQLIGNLRQGTTFFASATMIAIGGGLALIGNTDRLAVVAADLTLENTPAVVWEVKIMAVLLFLVNAFLKFVWAHRLFGYCSVLMAAVPNDANAPTAYTRAAQAAEINITAARSFNRGMRATYFSLAAAAWLFGPIPLLLAALVTIAILWRREFASRSREILLNSLPDTQP